MIVVVRPWKLPSKATMTASSAGTPLTSYPHLRAVLIAVSTASAPVFIGSTISRPARRPRRNCGRRRSCTERTTITRHVGDPRALGLGDHHRQRVIVVRSVQLRLRPQFLRGRRAGVRCVTTCHVLPPPDLS